MLYSRDLVSRAILAMLRRNASRDRSPTQSFNVCPSVVGQSLTVHGKDQSLLRLLGRSSPTWRIHPLSAGPAAQLSKYREDVQKHSLYAIICHLSRLRVLVIVNSICVPNWYCLCMIFIIRERRYPSLFLSRATAATDLADVRIKESEPQCFILTLSPEPLVQRVMSASLSLVQSVCKQPSLGCNLAGWPTPPQPLQVRLLPMPFDFPRELP